jgi:hypothetical protein
MDSAIVRRFVENVVFWQGYKLQVLRFEIRSDVYKLDNFGRAFSDETGG